MTLDMPAELQAFVTMVVDKGSFPSEAEAVFEGIRLLRDRELSRQELRQAIQEGIDSKSVDGELVLSRLEKRANVCTSRTFPTLGLSEKI